MTTAAERLQRFIELKPARFRFLERFELLHPFRDGRATEPSLRVRLAPDLASPDRLVLDFHGVRQLEVGNLERIVGLLLAIRDVRGEQLEGLTFKVVEEEHSTFSFYCADFDWELISATPAPR